MSYQTSALSNVPQAETSCLAAGSLILVTGANGYIASHIIDLLLNLGYAVRGTVRSKRPWLDEFFCKKYGVGRFESVTLPLLGDETALKEAMIGVSGVLHVASDVSMSSDVQVISNNVTTTLNLLKSAAQQKSVTRVVLTSSSFAALLPRPNEHGIIVNQDSWNDFAVNAAHNPNTPPEQKALLVYAASKTESERQAWKWVAENKPGFVFNTVLPDTNFGKILHPEIRGSTMSLARNILFGDVSAIKYIAPQWFVDVEDTARVHVAALLSGAVTSERIFAFAAPFNWTDILQVLRRTFPENTHLPDNPENEARDLSEVPPSRRAKQLLKEFWGRSGWTTLEDSIVAGMRDV
ncbi:hypothetical protein BBP40_008875 [Aspergillus hancockii]|nr:hypothetical protein BBP40_008875 [Aspergillus hancockii]